MPELDLGNVKGPQGKSAYQSALDAGYSGSEEAFNTAMAKAPDAVLYTAQSLSDTQKAQARTNINAAPGGYGYGDTLAVIDINNDEAAFNTALDALLSGLENYVTKQIRFANYPVGGQQGSTFFGTLYKHDASFAILYGSSYTGGTIQKCKSQGAWQPWEWVNPPMVMGVEYRTTERYLGKPVYTQIINCGSMPNIDNSKSVSIAALNVSVVTFISGWCTYYAAIFDEKLLGMTMSANNLNIIVFNLNREFNDNAVMYAQIKYTKTTD